MSDGKLEEFFTLFRDQLPGLGRSLFRFDAP
jgi:hypothetical protein